jgi:hypothetical protein
MVCGSNYSILKLQSAASSVCGKWRKQQLCDPHLPPHAADEAAALEDAAETSCSHRFEGYRAIGVTRGCARTNRHPSSFAFDLVVVVVRTMRPTHTQIKSSDSSLQASLDST